MPKRKADEMSLDARVQLLIFYLYAGRQAGRMVGRWEQCSVAGGKIEISSSVSSHCFFNFVFLGYYQLYVKAQS